MVIYPIHKYLWMLSSNQKGIQLFSALWVKLKCYFTHDHDKDMIFSSSSFRSHSGKWFFTLLFPEEKSYSSATGHNKKYKNELVYKHHEKNILQK